VQTLLRSTRRIALLPPLLAAALLTGVPGALAAGDVNQASCPAAAEASPGFRATLPDCRAYELATPPSKFGEPARSGAVDIPFLDETHLRSNSIGAFGEAGANSGVDGSNYLLTRGGEGWQSEALDAPRTSFQIPLGISGGFGDVLDVSRNFAATLLLASPRGTKPVDLRFYLSEPQAAGTSCPAGSVLTPGACDIEVGPAVPPAAVANWKEDPVGPGSSPQKPFIIYRGAAHDLSHIVFSSQPPVEGEPNWLWPGDTSNRYGTAEGTSLYEYVGLGNPAPSQVALDNNGSLLSQCGAVLGGREGFLESKATHDAISVQGTTVIFTTAKGGCVANLSLTVGTGPTVGQLYARIGNPGGSQTTVNLAGSTGCTTSSSCNITTEPKFQGASETGSRVFFTSTQPLTAGDTDATNNIYECDVPGDGAATPPAVGAVNPCPDLKPVSLTTSPNGAKVQSVVAISEDGSHVYFVAEGELADNQNANGETATLNADNLYVYERDASFPSGHIAFIGKVSESEPLAETTPDGRFLLFASSSPITPDAHGTSEQLYRYDAEPAGAEAPLVRVSVGEGSLDDQEGKVFSFQNANHYDKTIGIAAFAGPRGVAISNDGQYVFFYSSTGLTERALNNEVLLCGEEEEGECVFRVRANNIYEYHAGHVYLLSDGQDRHSEFTGSAVQMIGASPSGTDVFFQTADQLVPQDTDTQQDVYDARIDGGFPGLPSPASCQETCQGALTPPPSPLSAASTTFSGPGNAPPPTPVPAATPKPKPPTRAQKLAKALEACKRRPKRQRAACVKQTQEKYGAKAHRTTHSHADSNSKGR
jgi:hypothetical protein